MMGSDSINLSLKNIWHSWFNFRKGKRMTEELHEFQYHLEKNLSGLQDDLKNGLYRHSSCRKFIVCDNKRGEISVAGTARKEIERKLREPVVSPKKCKAAETAGKT